MGGKTLRDAAADDDDADDDDAVPTSGENALPPLRTPQRNTPEPWTLTASVAPPAGSSAMPETPRIRLLRKAAKPLEEEEEERPNEEE